MGGGGERLTPEVQTTTNGEQVWQREGERDEEKRKEEGKRWMLLPARLKSKPACARCA